MISDKNILLQLRRELFTLFSNNNLSVKESTLNSWRQAGRELNEHHGIPYFEDAAHFCIGPDCEDFMVEEVLSPEGLGPFHYFYVEKRNLTTQALLNRLCRELSIPSGRLGVCGQKDRHSISRQWISCEGSERLAVDFERSLGRIDGTKLLDKSKGPKPLKKGTHEKNRFEIRLKRESLGSGIECDIEKFIIFCAKKSLPNYFGPQRFGRSFINASLGEALIRGDEPEFCRIFNESEGRTVRSARSVSQSLKSFFIHSYQSRIFNDLLFTFGSNYENETLELAGDHVNELMRELLLSNFGLMGAQLRRFGHAATRRCSLEVKGLTVVNLSSDCATLRFELPAGSYATVALGFLVGRFQRVALD